MQHRRRYQKDPKDSLEIQKIVEQDIAHSTIFRFVGIVLIVLAIIGGVWLIKFWP